MKAILKMLINSVVHGMEDLKELDTIWVVSRALVDHE